MADRKCSICGGIKKYIQGEGCVCQSCGRVTFDEDISETLSDKFNKANSLRNRYYFNESLKVCKEILSEKPDSQEANWCALLSEYQIVYLQNDKGEWTATFLDPDSNPVPMNESSYALKLNSVQHDDMLKIEEDRQKAIAESAKIPPYDVFISYKQHAGGSKTALTVEAEWADELYKYLTKKKLRVFMDKYSLGGRMGWEAHIFGAIRSAKYMVVLGSSISNIESPWVKNEWMRFAYLQKHDRSKILSAAIPYSRFPDKMRLNEKLRNTQIADTDQSDWKEKLAKDILAVVDSSARPVPLILSEAEERIRHGKFKKAKKLYEEIINRDPKNVDALWGLVCCKYKAFDNYDIIKSRKMLDDFAHNEYSYLIDAGDDSSDKKFYKIKDDQVKHNTQEYDRPNYLAYRKNSRPKRILKILASITCVLALGAFGIYSYFGISNPVKYEVDGGEATLSGKSIYFNLVVKDLKVDTYEENPVVKIGDGVFKNSKLKSVTLSDTVEEIGDSAFEGSEKLTSVNILNPLIIIGDNAFASCTSLKSIEISSCTYIGEGAFSACTNLTELKLGLTDTTVVKENAFANLGRNVTISLPSVSETIADKLKSEYPDVNFTTYTQDKVQECIYFIAKLSSVAEESDADIKKAESLYNGLSDSEKAKITNYGVLQNARASYDAVAAIKAIGTVTLDSEEKIIAAENVYNTLTSEQKKTVSNYSTLTTARAVYNTMAQIADIGVVDLYSEPKIEKAEEAYLALSYTQRDLVSNYSVLTAARTTVDTLLSNEVISKISAIGKVSLDSEGKITAAETGYNSLTDAQKNRVTNYETLTDARVVYNTIVAINNIGTITTTSGNAINTAQSLFDTLTSAQKLNVINLNDLTDAVAVYPVVVSISALNKIVVSDLAKIESAELNYTALSPMQKNKVSNYTMLTDARTVYDTVILIDGIGEITENSGDKIELAQSSYAALNSVQKGIVGNHSTLTNSIAAYEVVLKILSIDGVITVDSNQSIKEVELSYGALTAAQQKLVSNYSVLKDARSVCDVEIAIDNIGIITVSSGNAINTAENAYKNLSAGLKLKVVNYSDLTDAAAAFSVVTKIGTLSKVNADSLAQIEDAEAEYTALNASQQARVSNYSDLTDARAVYPTVLLIDEIGTVSENSGTKIETAQSSYNALTANQKNIVGNYEKLADANMVYGVISKIKAIGTVSLSSSSAITEAENAYNALTSAQKQAVTNYAVLETSNSVYNLMTVIGSQGTVKLGSGTSYSYKTLSTSTMVEVLNNAEVRNSVDSVTITGLSDFKNQDKWTAVFKKLYLVRYDVTDGLSITSYKFTPSNLTYRLVGSTSTYNIALSATSGDVLNLEFENFNFKSSGISLDINNISVSNIAFLGACSITSGTGYKAVYAKDINFSLYDGASVGIRAGDGTSSINGGNGIDAINCTINSKGTGTATFAVKAGNGISGTKGTDGDNGTNGGNGQAGTNGTSGKNGTNATSGGIGLNAQSLIINCNSSTTITFSGGIGGNGGAGGNGGRGGNAGAVGPFVATGDTRAPGKAGNGGAGGGGGNSGNAVTVNLYFKLQSGKCVLNGLNGGAGGAGGNGGNGGNGGANGWNKPGGNGNGANGGAGGAGGNGGNAGKGCSMTVQKSTSATLINNNGLAGKGGAGGNGGAGGLKSHSSCVDGSAGSKGKAGADGSGS